MSSNSDVDEFLQSLTTFVTVPFVLAAAEAIRQPAVQSLIREGYVLSERANEAMTEVQETLEDLAAQAQAKLTDERSVGDLQPLSDVQPNSDVATAINRLLSTFNKHTHQMTKGAVDLRLLTSIAFATLAIRQALQKGINLDDVPWYTLAWYAISSFPKSNSSMADPLVDLGEDLAEFGES